MEIKQLSRQGLLKKCQELGIKKCKSKNKSELISLIETSSQPPENEKPSTQPPENEKPSTQPPENEKPSTQPPENEKPSTQPPENEKPSTQPPDIIIINADCMEELRKLPDHSIDCVITDPPYFIDKLDNNWSSDKVNSDVKNSHIKHLPKGMKFDKSQVKNLYDYYFGTIKAIVSENETRRIFPIIFVTKIISRHCDELRNCGV